MSKSHYRRRAVRVPSGPFAGGTLALLVVLLTGCASTRGVVPAVERKDSIVIRTETRVDSVWRDRWHVIERKGDTVFVRDSVFIDRWRAVHQSDTVCLRDSVPVVTEVPVIVRRRNGYDRFVSWGFWILFALIALTVAVKVMRLIRY